MTVTIIEDRSPYYIKFTFPGIEAISQHCNSNYDYNTIQDILMTATYDTISRSYLMYRLKEVQSKVLFSNSAFFDMLPFDTKHNLIFLTKPGGSEKPHKDGASVKCAINFGIGIQDELCETRWYNDETLSEYKPSTNKLSKFADGYKFDKHTPDAVTVIKQNEAMLFNTDIYHEWDNRKSNNRRDLLTLRFVNPKDMLFTDIRKILFGY